MTCAKGMSLKLAAPVAALAVMTAVAGALPAVTTVAQEQSRQFPETGRTVKGKFLQYWDSHGGLTQQGFPISDEMQERSDTDGKTYTVQYFERAVFELHPGNQPPYDVLLSLLGTSLYKQKYSNGAASQKPSAQSNARVFSETGKKVGGIFLDYWNSHGGLAQQGFPISDEFQEKSDLDGKTYTVQYFERAVFEYHRENAAPNNVLLSQLGTFQYRARYAKAGDSEPTVQPTPVANSSGAGSVEEIGSMTVARACHSATMLPNGKVLLAGGSQRGGVNNDTAELYDPATGKFTATGKMAVSHICHEAVLLPNGKVLIVGGSLGDGGDSAELYDPETGTFSRTGNLNKGRHEPFAATLLKNGTVLVTGGYDAALMSNAEIYDPATGKFTVTSSMNEPRANHTSTLLLDGKVLIMAGGISEPSWGIVEMRSTAEIYDPATGKFTLAGDLPAVRYKHATVLMSDGKVMVIAGSDERQLGGLYGDTLIYDPTTGKFTDGPDLTGARYKIGHAVASLSDGRIMVAGGDRVEVYNPSIKSFTVAEGSLGSIRFFQTATVLRDGSVLITGGNNPGFQSTRAAWVFHP
jgi:hypothetical protein